MDEVDKIIVHSLRQIGCSFDGDNFTMANFTPELVVNAVSTCIQQIKPHLAVPRLQPDGGMAQHHSVASCLAELCASCGYRNDIGYQTFLYPNPVDVRRLLMFLIEQLPKEHCASQELVSAESIGDFEMLQREIKEKLNTSLKQNWVPQYCRAVANRRYDGCSSQNIAFQPQLNLNVFDLRAHTKEELSYMQQQAPNVFQQTLAPNYDLISSVLHKNALDLHSNFEHLQGRKFSLRTTILCTANISSSKPNVQVSEDLPGERQRSSVLSPLEKLNEEVNMLKSETEAVQSECKAKSAKINVLIAQHADAQSDLQSLQKELKTHERTCVILEDPAVNVEKLESWIPATQDRRKTLEQQWQAYRVPMQETLQALQAVKLTKNMQNVMDLRVTIAQLEQTLREKTTQHHSLGGELRSQAKSAAPRREYTRRILEFIGNIRKQRNDIFKVIDDTRDLQKQLNSVSAQLQRQFSYTDDLLFQSAKHDLHAKRAYKLLAALHATCSELVELVTQTGNVTKEIRDVEVQIDREKTKNIAKSLEQILADTRSFENVIRSIQVEIQKVENRIVEA